MTKNAAVPTTEEVKQISFVEFMGALQQLTPEQLTDLNQGIKDQLQQRLDAFKSQRAALDASLAGLGIAEEEATAAVSAARVQKVKGAPRGRKPGNGANGIRPLHAPKNGKWTLPTAVLEVFRRKGMGVVLDKTEIAVKGLKKTIKYPTAAGSDESFTSSVYVTGINYLTRLGMLAKVEGGWTLTKEGMKEATANAKIMGV